jgi:hypothetical protein
MRIGSNRGIALAADFRASRDRGAPDTERLPPEKSLVPLRREAAEAPPVQPARNLAAFVTQLIAKEQDALHLRARNRAEPAEAIEAYLRVLRLGGVPKRHKARPF